MEASSKVPLRRTRERELVTATRSLFDERGMQHAPIEEIAKAAGIARGLIYRQFSSKEELYVLTVTDYLDELAGVLSEATAGTDDPAVQLEGCVEAYLGFCERYPAFLDSALSLMQRPARELQETISESVWIRLGQGMARCVDPLAQILRAGDEQGVFDVDDPDRMANLLWTQGLGVMHLARIRVGVREAAPGVPELFALRPDEVLAASVASAMATVGARRR